VEGEKRGRGGGKGKEGEVSREERRKGEGGIGWRGVERKKGVGRGWGERGGDERQGGR